jgi:hypothetical protein
MKNSEVVVTAENKMLCSKNLFRLNPDATIEKRGKSGVSLGQQRTARRYPESVPVYG